MFACCSCCKSIKNLVSLGLRLQCLNLFLFCFRLNIGSSMSSKESKLPKYKKYASDYSSDDMY